MIVYQIWYQTSVGPTFSTREKAIEHLAKDEDHSGRYAGYPDIEEIIVDDDSLFMRDR